MSASSVTRVKFGHLLRAIVAEVATSDSKSCRDTFHEGSAEWFDETFGGAIRKNLLSAVVSNKKDALVAASAIIDQSLREKMDIGWYFISWAKKNSVTATV